MPKMNTFASPRPACHFGFKCNKVGCAFQHPPGFVPMCRNGATCTHLTAPHGCSFRHNASEAKSRPASSKVLPKTLTSVPRPAKTKSQGFGDRKHAVVTKTQSHVETVGCTQRDLFLMLDMSGSMCGAPVRDVQTCTKDIVGSVVRPGDRLELTTFSSSVHAPVLPLAQHDAKAFEHAVDGLRPGGMTALWRAVIAAVDRAAAVYQRGNKRFVEVVLMTDGDDTSCSDDVFEEARARVAKPGCVLKFFVVSCGSSASTRQQLERLCAPAHCKLFVEDNVADLRQAFGKVKRELVSVTTTKTARVVQKVVHGVKTQVRRTRLT